MLIFEKARQPNIHYKKTDVITKLMHTIVFSTGHLVVFCQHRPATTLREHLDTFFQYSAAGCPPLEKLGRDSSLLDSNTPCGSPDDNYEWVFGQIDGGNEESEVGKEAGWENVTGYVQEYIDWSDGMGGGGLGSRPPSAWRHNFEIEDVEDGSYVLAYNFTASGVYQLEIIGTASGLPLHGAPYALLVQPGPLHAPSVGVNLDSPVAVDLEDVEAGTSTALDLVLRDMHGNRRWSWEGGQPFLRRMRQAEPWRGGMQNMSDPTHFQLGIRPMNVSFYNAVRASPDFVVWRAQFSKLTFQDYGGGLVRADYTVTTAGRFQLEISLGGVPLGGGSPYLFIVRAGKADMEATSVFGAVSICQAGIRCAMHVEVRDSWGNRRILEDDSGPNCHRNGLLADCVPVDSDAVLNGQRPSCLDPASGQPGENSKAASSCGDASFGSFLVIFPDDALPQRKEPERLLLTAANVYSGGYNITTAGTYMISVVWDARAAGRRTSGATQCD